MKELIVELIADIEEREREIEIKLQALMVQRAELQAEQEAIADIRLNLQDILKKECRMKAFNNLKHNHIHITFPNGNCISCLWGVCSYSDNKDAGREKGADAYIASFKEFLDSDTCEIKVIEAPQELVDKIQSKYGDPTDSVVGYVTVTQWLEILNMLAKE